MMLSDSIEYFDALWMQSGITFTTMMIISIKKKQGNIHMIKVNTHAFADDLKIIKSTWIDNLGATGISVTIVV